MARYENKGPVMNLRRGRTQQSTWNTTQGPEGGQKELPSKFNTRTGELGPTTFGEVGTTRDDFREKSPAFERNRGIDPSTFDVSDPEQVLAFQRQAGLEEDAMFGPKTKAAWEQYVNRTRASGGEEQYDFGSPKSLVDLVDKEGRPDDAAIQEQIGRNEEAGMYQNDASQEGGWDRLGSSLSDTAEGWGNWFRNKWNSNE